MHTLHTQLLFSSLSANPVDSEINVTGAVSFLSYEVIKTWFVSCSKVVVQDRQSEALSYLLLNF
jgi:hypothetical protein